MARKVIIIGGGIGGLATANLLAKAGFTVSVYEKNKQLGGRAGLKRAKGFTFDTGPSWYLMPKVFQDYFRLFGRDAKKELSLKKLSPAYKVFFEHADPLTITSDLKKDAQTFDAVEPGAGTALKRYVREGNHIYQLALKHFLYTNFTKKSELAKPSITRNLPQLSSLLLKPLHSRVRSFVNTKQLQQILEYPMVFLGSSPFSAPAMYSLMSALDFKEGVYYPKNGIYSIIELLVGIGKELGVSYHTNTNVTQIVTEGRQATGIRLANGEHIAGDIIVSNADLHHTEVSLLKPRQQTYPANYWKKKDPGISALLLYVGYKGKLPQLKHHNLYFVDDWKQNFKAIYKDKIIPKSASLYICKPTATDKSLAPKGHENLFILIPLPTKALTKRETKQLTKRTLRTIGNMINVQDFTNNIVYQETFTPTDFHATYNSWQGSALGMSHILRQSALWRPQNKSKKLKNLYYVGGNTVPGVGLPMCLIGAELVYKRIIGEKQGGHIRSIKRREV